jgi:hypothetical protein
VPRGLRHCLRMRCRRHSPPVQTIASPSILEVSSSTFIPVPVRKARRPRGAACRTVWRSAVWAPPSRRRDSTPMPLRRPDPLQRLVRQRFGHEHECCLPVGVFRAFVRRTSHIDQASVATVVA